MATVTLTDRDDHYTTTSNDSLVLAKGGNDVITVQAAYYDRENEIVQIAVYGGPGNDKIIGKPVADREAFYGGPGNDRIEVWGSVTYSGAALGAGGNDTLVCKGGDEGCNLLGGSGNDTLVNEGTTSAYMTGGPGRDTLVGGASRDVFLFRAGDTVAGFRPRRHQGLPARQRRHRPLGDRRQRQGTGRPGLRLRRRRQASGRRRGQLLRLGPERDRGREHRRQDLRDRAPGLRPAARRHRLPPLGRAVPEDLSDRLLPLGRTPRDPPLSGASRHSAARGRAATLCRSGRDEGTAGRRRRYQALPP